MVSKSTQGQLHSYRDKHTQDNSFLFPSSVTGIHAYYPSGLLPTSVSAPAASVQDLASFTPWEGYLIPISDTLAALKCPSVLATVVLSRCGFTIALQGCIFCLFALWLGASNLKCLWASCQRVAFRLDPSLSLAFLPPASKCQFFFWKSLLLQVKEGIDSANSAWEKAREKKK